MEDLNRATIRIMGSDYVVMTDEAPMYVEELGRQIDEKVKKILGFDDRISLTAATILCALDYLNDLTKASQSADNMRGQVKDYLEDSAKARIEVEELKRQIEKLKSENKALKGKNSDGTDEK